MNKKIKFLLFGLIFVFTLVQFVPSNLPENNNDLSNDFLIEEGAPENIKLIFSKACYDCHSNQTSYPWYAHVAPVSWLVAKDTREGREELNFSDWAELSKRKKIKILNELAEEVEKKNMPLNIYTVVHRDAILTEKEISAIATWTKSVSDKILNGE